MHVAGDRGFGRVDVGMGIDPDQAEFLILAAMVFRYSSDRPSGHGVVAT